MGTKVRVLCAITIDGASYRPDHVVDFPAALARALAADGSVDTNKDAVAYCINDLGAAVTLHAAPAGMTTERTAL